MKLLFLLMLIPFALAGLEPLEEPKNDTICLECKRFVTNLHDQLVKNRKMIEENIDHTVKFVCRFVPFVYPECVAVMSKIVHNLIEEIANDTTTTKLCYDLLLCDTDCAQCMSLEKDLSQAKTLKDCLVCREYQSNLAAACSAACHAIVTHQGNPANALKEACEAFEICPNEPPPKPGP